MRSKAIGLALLVLAFGAQARPVLQFEAEKAARTWSRSGTVLGTHLGRGVGHATLHRTDADVPFYSVKMEDGGTIFMAGDTTARPIVAFTSEAADFQTIDKASPLWALLNRDQNAQVIANAATASGTGSATATSTAVSEAERLWAELLEDDVPSNPGIVSPAKTHVSGLSDKRAGPLVKSQWDQSRADGKNCYNYYTPQLSDGTRAVCGCVATAMSQIMRYHRYPAKSAVVTRTCYVQASTRSKTDATVSLKTAGESFAWESMPLKPADGVSDAQCKAIGRLTSDAGISVCMSYDTTGKGGSGSFAFNVAPALKGVFGYASADYYGADEITKHPAVVRQAMLSNFDAGYPVLMGISGAGGHAVVGDGYGYKDDKLYVHLNMGWSGSNDVWYNLPDIDAGFYHFTVFDDVVFNIFPTAAEGLSTLSGRVVDDEGTGVDDATVLVRAAGTEETVAADRTTNGVFGVRVAKGEYDVEVITSDGTLSERRDGLSVPGTISKLEDKTGWIVKGSWTETYRDIPVVSSVGNLQLLEAIVLSQPTVRIGGTMYASLDKALVAARESVPPVEVTIIAATELRKSVDIDFPCVLTTEAGGDPDLLSVMRLGDAKLTVSAGGSVNVSDVKFEGSSTTLFEVDAGGSVAVGAGVSFGVPDTVAAIETADADGFVLTDGLRESFAVRCLAAMSVNAVFGHATCDFATASDMAARIINLDDPDGELAGAALDGGTAPYDLVWAMVPVPLEDATAYYVMADDPATTNCFRRLDRLFELFELEESVATVTIVKDGTLSRKVAPKADLTILSETGAVISGLSGEAGFKVGDGVKLSVRGLTFDDCACDALFLVDGGELELGGDTVISNVSGTNPTYSGAVAVLKGRAVIGSSDGSVEFENCFNDTQGSYGGAVYLAGTGCELVLQERVSITGCNARSGGGGVYMGSGADVRLSGFLTVKNNTSGADRTKASDLFYERSKTAANTLLLGGLVEPGSEIGLAFGGTAARLLSKEGGEFIDVAEDFTDKVEILKSCAGFFCDGKESDLFAEPNDDYAALRWKAVGSEIPEVDPAAAVASVNVGGTKKYYGSLEDAFSVAQGLSVTIELLADAEMESDIAVDGTVTLTSGAGGPYVISRIDQCHFTVTGSLTVENVEIAGRLDGERGGDGLLFDVLEGGDMTLGVGAVIRDVSGGSERSAGAVKVYKGTFTMLSGAEIRNCVNPYSNPASENSRGGAVTADTLSVVRFMGGRIVDCSANRGGGAFIGNESTVEIGGDFECIGNLSVLTSRNNLCVSGRSSLLLASPLGEDVGYFPGEGVDAAVFGRVAESFPGTDAEIANSAHRFSHDITGDVGFAVRNGNETLLVWGDALDVNGNYTDEKGKVYKPVVGGDIVKVPVPSKVDDLVYNGQEQVGVEAGHGFTVVGDTGKDADEYVATLTIKKGFAWDDASGDTKKTIPWEIAPAPLTVTADAKSKVKGEDDPALTYEAVGFQGNDTVASVLTGELARESGEEAGTYAIEQGTLAVVGNNYDLTFIGAAFTITDPGPGPQPVPVPCKPFKFTAIVRQADGSFLLTINPAVKYCKYTLRTSNDITADRSTWTPVGGEIEATETGDLNFNPAGGDLQRFWDVIGVDGVEPAP